VIDPGSFAPNPDGLDIGLGVHVIPALEQGPDATQFTVLVGAEVTDAPTMDVTVDNTVPFADDLKFSEAGSFGLVAAKDHGFDFIEAATKKRIAKSFVQFFDLRGRAGILLATGFVDSTTNQNGPAFSTFLVLDDGTTRHFDRIFTSVESAPVELPQELTVHGAYPNPFRSEANVLFDLPDAATVSLRLFDATGRLVFQNEPRLIAVGQNQSVLLSAAGLSAGMYFYRLIAESASGSHAAHGQLMLVR
jgi:hypothetical protein